MPPPPSPISVIQKLKLSDADFQNYSSSERELTGLNSVSNLAPVFHGLRSFYTRASTVAAELTVSMEMSFIKKVTAAAEEGMFYAV